MRKKDIAYFIVLIVYSAVMAFGFVKISGAIGDDFDNTESNMAQKTIPNSALY